MQHVAPLVEGEGEGLKLWIGPVMPKPRLAKVFFHEGAKQPVPDDDTPAKLRSMYLALLAWCTLWWEGC